jgi:hypothetical protein
MGRRERQQHPTIDESSFSEEKAPEMLKALSAGIVEGRKKMEQAFVDERVVKTRLVEQIFAAIGGCLPLISSKLPFGAPYDTGIHLLTRHAGSPNEERLYIAEEGFFFLYEGGTSGGIKDYSPSLLVEDRWNVRELILALGDEMLANYEGQARKTANVEKLARKMSAVAELLDVEK